VKGFLSEPKGDLSELGELSGLDERGEPRVGSVKSNTHIKMCRSPTLSLILFPP